MQIDLPWPPGDLSPNARLHWAAKARVAGKYKRSCVYLTREAIKLATAEAPVHMVITFHPPDSRRRDMDNMVASLKSGMDGLAYALRVDDSLFIPTYQIGASVKGGRVTVEITSAMRIPYRGQIT